MGEIFFLRQQLVFWKIPKMIPVVILELVLLDLFSRTLFLSWMYLLFIQLKLKGITALQFNFS